MADSRQRFLDERARQLGGRDGVLRRPGLTVIGRPLPAAAPGARVRPFWLVFADGAVLVSCLAPLKARIGKLFERTTDHKAVFAADRLAQVAAELGKYLNDVVRHHGYGLAFLATELPYRETEPVVRLDDSHRLALELFDETAPERLRPAMARGDVFGILRDEELLAVAAVTERAADCWTVDVRVASAVRGHGHGRQAAEEVTRHALQAGKIATFTARHDDAAANHLGHALGYTRLTEEAWFDAVPK